MASRSFFSPWHLRGNRMMGTRQGMVLRTDLAPVLHGVAMERVIVMPRLPLGRINGVCLASIPQELWIHPDVGIEWVPGAPGATNLAACILDRWYPPAAGDVTTVDGRAVPCRALVVQLAPRFAAQVITRTPYWGGFLDRDQILAWLSRQPEIKDHPIIDLAEVIH